MMEKLAIKGKNFLGFEIEINSDSIDDIKKEVELILASSAHFLKNTIITLKLNKKNKILADDILAIFKDKDIDINAVIVENRNGFKTKIPVIETKDMHMLAEKKEERAATYKGNLRNGQTVKVDGDLIVTGNVNANSFVYATGNIFVLGKLNGIPHAGYGGNNDAVIFAFSLNPPQIRIGDFITRSPEEGVSLKHNNTSTFEVAYVDDGNIMITTYEDWLKLKR